MRFSIGLICASLCLTSICLQAYGQAQQEPSTDGGAQTATPQAQPAPSADFEEKLTRGEVLVRKKGTQEWLPISKFTEPVDVGLLDGHKIYVVTKAIKVPKVRYNEDPSYPPGEEGKPAQAVLRVVVDEKGLVRYPKVLSSSGAEYAEIAIRVVKGWKFAPATLNGEPVPVLILITIDWEAVRSY
jgi:TonB family protein